MSHQQGGHISLSPDEGQIVQAITRERPMSRTELARRLSCSRAKAGELVNDLIGRGILEDVDTGRKTRSRQVGINHELGVVLGVDLGTTSLDVALADLGGRIITHHAEPWAVERGPQTTLNRVHEVALELARPFGIPVEGIRAVGMGVPGPVRFPDGFIIGEHFLPGWDGLIAREHLARLFPNAVITVDNDANVMAIGSMRQGRGGDVSSFVFVKVGTGIGAGVVVDRKLVRGATSTAGHIGHTCVDFNGPICRCGNHGCLEAMAAGPAIARRAREAALAGRSPILADCLKRRGGALTAQDVSEAAAQGDAASLNIIQESGRMIGDILAGVVNVLNPDLVIVGGGVSKSGYQFLAAIRRGILNRSYPYATVRLRIEYSPIADRVGVIGCSTLATDWLFEVEGKSLEAANAVGF
jgi:predicted NBD/HSP70 family sugar kinase